MKKYRRGLVVGKFAPLHLGHDSVIRLGLEECEEFFILSYSNPEFVEFPPEMREAWLRDLYPEAEILVLSQNKNGYQIPENSAHEDIHRDFVAKVYRDRSGRPLDVVYTSESYGDGFANRLSKNLIEWKLQNGPVRHINVDQDRRRFPISGTLLRASPHENRHYLPQAVYATLIQSVCLLGAESTGKSTLAKALAERMNTSFADEYGRTLWEEKEGRLEFPDFLKIAQRQIEKEQEARSRAHRYFFADTSPLTTLFYSESYCGKVDPALRALSFRRYAHLFLCMPDFALVQDGTRADEAFRTSQHEWYLRILSERNVPFQVLKGPLVERIETVVSYLSLKS